VTISVTKRLSYAIDGVEVAAFSLPVPESELDRAISLTTLKEVRAMATVVDALEAAEAASAAKIDVLQSKEDAVLQLLNDLKGAPGISAADQARIQAVIDKMAAGTAKVSAAEDGLDAAVAP
jgi:hypothetical protein